MMTPRKDAPKEGRVDYRWRVDRDGGFEKATLIYDREGRPCPRCGTPIERVDYEEHTVYYCPDCQTGGRLLKDRRLSRLLR